VSTPRTVSALLAAPRTLASALNDGTAPLRFSPCGSRRRFASFETATEAVRGWDHVAEASSDGFIISNTTTTTTIAGPLMVQYSKHNSAASAIGISSIAQQLVYPSQLALGITASFDAAGFRAMQSMLLSMMLALFFGAVAHVYLMLWLRGLSEGFEISPVSTVLRSVGLTRTSHIVAILAVSAPTSAIASLVFPALYYVVSDDGSFSMLDALLAYELGFGLSLMISPSPAEDQSMGWAFAVIGVVGAATAAAVGPVAVIALAVVCPPAAACYGLIQILLDHTLKLAVSPGACAVLLVLQRIVYMLHAEHKARGISWQATFTRHRSSYKHVSSADRDNASDHGVVIEGLTKRYEDGKVAVDDVSLKVPRGEIVALLGHNGAGKTTLLQILMGVVKPTSSAQCTIAGFDLDQLQQIRERTGCCFQSDHFIDTFSGLENLELIGRIRGMDATRAIECATELLRRLDLPLDGQRVGEYSGGMKRRLSVAGALVGDCPVLIFDEPSAGVDPLNRQRLWSLLKQERDKGKCILLSTHLMKEADYLSDRIAIMSHGRIVAFDTSAKLKAAHSVGYYLTVAKLPHASDAFRKDALLALCEKHCEGAALANEMQNEVVVKLPLDAADRFGPLLQSLENSLVQLRAASFGISANSLEDVFIAIAEQQIAVRSIADAHVGVETMPMEDEDEDTHVNDAGRSVAAEFAAASEVRGTERMWAQARSILRLRWSRHVEVLQFCFLTLLSCGLLIGAFIVFGPSLGSTRRGLDHSTPSSLSAPLLHPLPVLKWPVVLPDPWTGATYQGIRASLDEECMRSVLSHFVNAYNAHYAGPSSLMSTEIHGPRSVQLATWPLSHSLTPPPALLFHGCAPVGFVGDWRVNYSWFYPDEYAVGPLYQLDFALRMGIDRWATESRGDAWVDHGATNFAALPKSRQALNRQAHSDQDVNTLFAAALCVAMLVTAGSMLIMNDLPLPAAANDDIAPSADWCTRVVTCTICCVPLVVTFIVGPTIIVASMRDACYLSMTSTALVTSLWWLYLACAVAIATRGITAGIIMSSTVLLCTASAVTPMLPEPYHSYDFVFPTRSFFALLDLRNDDRGAGCAWTRDSSAFKAFLSVCVWCTVCVVYIVYHTHRDWVARYFAARFGSRRSAADLPIDVDTDVAQEHARISQLLSAEAPTLTETAAAQHASDAYTVHNLSKTFRSGSDCSGKIDEPKVAVRSLSFGVRRGECFGLLGPNGAGKTTTVQLMLRQMLPDAGELSVRYDPLEEDSGSFPPTRAEMYRRYRFGVCRQSDEANLFRDMSVEENMHTFLSLRLAGRYRRGDWVRYVERALAKVMLLEHRAIVVEKLSGGLKRRLSVCLALFTGRLFILLDEPSRSIDPLAQRALRRCVREVLDDGRSVLLTTHSTEEAEAVCGRVGVIMNGSLRCLGSSQRLKSQFGSGYVVTLFLLPARDGLTALEQATTMDQHMTEAFGSSCNVRQARGQQRVYTIKTVARVSSIFTTLATKRYEWGVEDYSVSQLTTLEQVFIDLTGGAEDNGAPSARSGE
jgi:ABC-2 type transport system ATP-binding protein